MKMINNDEELRNGAFQRRKDEMDANARIHWAKTQGLKEGEERGKAQGLKEGMEKGKALGERTSKIRTAVNLFKEGQTAEFVSRITELPLEEAEKLKNQFI